MKNGIVIITAEHQKQGLNAAKDIIYKRVDNQTLLLLSGGSTPKGLYKILAQEGKIKAKAAGLVDERADGSNYKMIKSTGLLDYFENLKIKFYPMISASSYGRVIRKLIDSSGNKVAIMGIGEDGHTASLSASQRGEPPGIKNLKLKNKNYAMDVRDFPGEFKERVTLTFNALSKMDLLLILAFGENKKEALGKMFKEGPLEELPARFYTKAEIAKKTILITDQKI